MFYMLAVLTGTALMLSGCSERSAVETAMRENLKDPDSAKFGSFDDRKGPGGHLACLTVNARNSYGGYTGDQEVMLAKIDGNWLVGETKEISHEHCVKAIGIVASDRNAADS